MAKLTRAAHRVTGALLDAAVLAAHRGVLAQIAGVSFLTGIDHRVARPPFDVHAGVEADQLDTSHVVNAVVFVLPDSSELTPVKTGELPMS